VDDGEQCDDANNADGDCCAGNCRLEAQGSLCDDGLSCTTGETCDGMGVCRGDPSAGQYALLHWTPIQSSTVISNRALVNGNICGPSIGARRSTVLNGDLTSLISSGTAITIKPLTRVAGSVVTAGGEILRREPVTVGGHVLSDVGGTVAELTNCDLARTQVNDRYDLLTLLTPTVSYGKVKRKARQTLRVPESGELGAGVAVVQFEELRMGGSTTLTLVGSPTTTHVIVRVSGLFKLGRKGTISLQGLTPEQVIWVVGGDAVVCGSAKLQGTLLGTGRLITLRRSRVEGALLGHTSKVAGSSIINRRPWVGWCD
jgi:hypothetical protein